MNTVVSFRVVTLNILNEPKQSTWPLRAPLVVAELRALAPDIVLLQEVAWPDEQATALAEALREETGDAYTVHLTAHAAAHGRQGGEGLAILSRFPVLDRSEYQFPGSERSCQRVCVAVGGKTLDVYNVHLDPGSVKRVGEQVRASLGWMETHIAPDAVVFGGDFNASPDTEAIRQIRLYFQSAYTMVHGQEPAYTVPTPFRIALRRRQNLPVDYLTLDYVFLSSALTAVDARVVFADSPPDDPFLNPSDHFGLCADVQWA